MQLDKTHVAIRARSFSEIGDLSLSLIRHYPQAILVGLTVGALPWLIADLLLLGYIPWQEATELVFDEESVGNRIRYVWLFSVLVFLQAPLMGIFTTYYIGQAVFEQRPTWRSVFGGVLKIWGRLTWSLGIVRGPIPAMILLGLNWGQDFSPGIEVFWMLVILLYAGSLRAFRPFLPEILVLERCPLRSKNDSQISASRRTSLLHSPISGDLLGRFMLSGLLLALLNLAFFNAGSWLYGMLLNTSDGSLNVLIAWLPISYWLIVALATMIRYLSYLDSRIRLEGWEVELLLRAEAIRQFGEPEPAQGDVALVGRAS